MFLRIDPSGREYRDVYRLMVGAIVPRPIAFVSTKSKAGIRNLAPFSYFSACSSNPPCILFTATSRADGGGNKDTVANIRETREFVVNIVSEEMAERMNSTSAEFPPEVDEFDVSGLTATESELVGAPRVAESHIQMECRLIETVRVGQDVGGGTVVIGEVVLFHVDELVLADPAHDLFRVDPSRLRAIGRMGGATYVRTQDRFDLERPVYRK
ncbi:MAG TPA: flavin reductase family protein [Bryobacteraceae bacterium]|jgi:flavin reductase (DIM6/NTAB) family NADH-FMN oxidoreductase RutF|nr:flavin reductase family protein [Bryobacteraceae bacterium]